MGVFKEMFLGEAKFNVDGFLIDYEVIEDGDAVTLHYFPFGEGNTEKPKYTKQEIQEQEDWYDVNIKELKMTLSSDKKCLLLKDSEDLWFGIKYDDTAKKFEAQMKEIKSKGK